MAKSQVKKGKRSGRLQRKPPLKKEKEFNDSLAGVETLVNAVILLVALWFLLSYFNPGLLLMKTTINGGDVCAHNYLAGYMKDYLLPHGKLFGWSPGWWAGFPMFQYYFFMPYLLAAILSYLIPLEVAFKLVSVLGIFTLPLASYFGLKFMGFRFPIPTVGSILSLLFLFHERQTVWGINIPSTLSGEISVSISFSAMVLFLGLLYRSVREGRYSILCSLAFSFVILTHLTTALVAGLTSLFFLISLSKKRILENFVMLFKTYLLSFLLTAFWTLSIVSKWDYSVGFGEEWSINPLSLYPPEAWIAMFFAAYGLIVAFRRRDDAVFYLLFSLLSSIALFFSAYSFNLVNIRFWPFHYYCIFALASYGLVVFIENLLLVLNKAFDAVWLSGLSKRILPLILMVFVILYLDETLTFTKSWIAGNYEGFESKMAWGDYKSILLLLNNTPGRFANDLSDRNLPVGSSRVFENVPYFINKPMIEGGIVQSGLSSLFTYYIQCESSTHCAGFPRIMTPTSFNFTAATEHMKLYNVKHFVAVEESVKGALRSNPEWKLFGKYGPYEVYDLAKLDGKYVYIPPYAPALTSDNDWKFLSMRWFEDVSNLETPIAMVSKITDADKRHFSSIYPDNRVLWSTFLNKDSDYMGEWLLCGAFPNSRYVPWTPENSYNSSLDYGLDVEYLDESDFSPVEGEACAKGKKWIKYYGHKNGFTDLYTAYEPDAEGVVAYAATYVYSPSNHTVDFWYGSDDGVKVWLNNRLVHVNHVHRGTGGVTDHFELNLSAGWNVAVIKIENVVSGWGFYARMLDSEGRPVKGLSVRMSPDVPSGIVDLRANRIDRNCSIEESIENEVISFNTSCPGLPHIIKVSYFPNWKVEGAERVYLVTPDFMLVYPEGNYVKLYYASTTMDYFGLALTLLGLLTVVFHFIRCRRRKKDAKK